MLNSNFDVCFGSKLFFLKFDSINYYLLIFLRKYGEACSYAEISLTSLREAQTCKTFTSWGAAFSLITQDITKVQKECDNENSFIAHEKPVDPRMLQTPANKSIVSPTEFVPDQQQVIVA